jgi:hypothetical protein
VLHPHSFRTAAAECYATAQIAEDLTIKKAYLELMQGWRVLADEADRLKSRPCGRYQPVIAGPARQYVKANPPSRIRCGVPQFG